MMMALGAAAPLCGWFIAAYVTNTVGGFPKEDSSVSVGAGGPSGGRRRPRRRNARSKQLMSDGWSPFTGGGFGGSAGVDMLSYSNIVAFCGSSLNGIGSCLTFEGCPEYHKQPHMFRNGMAGIFGVKMFFGDGIAGLRLPKSLQAARRHSGKARTGHRSRCMPIVKAIGGPDQSTFLSPEEAGLIEMTNLDMHEKFLARLTVSSLNLLREISAQEGVPIEELNAGKLCDWFVRDKEKRDEDIGEATLKWKTGEW